jgi:helix-turn-helix protein
MSAQVSAAHAARMYGRSEKTVRRWIAAGKLPAEKIDGAYLVDLADVARIVGDVSTPTSAPTSAPGADTMSAQDTDTDVRTDEGDVRPTPLAQADALASLIQATLTPIIAPLVGELAASRQALERQAGELRELEREVGRVSALLDSARAQIRTLTAPTASQSVEPATEPRVLFLRRRWLWVMVLVAFVVLIVALLAWPR